VHVGASLLGHGNRRRYQRCLTLIGWLVHLGLAEILLGNLSRRYLLQWFLFHDRGLHWGLRVHASHVRTRIIETIVILRKSFLVLGRNVLEQILVGLDNHILGRWWVSWLLLLLILLLVISPPDWLIAIRNALVLNHNPLVAYHIICRVYLTIFEVRAVLRGLYAWDEACECLCHGPRWRPLITFPNG
jgi:hypothetical protein